MKKSFKLSKSDFDKLIAIASDGNSKEQRVVFWDEMSQKHGFTPGTIERSGKYDEFIAEFPEQQTIFGADDPVELRAGNDTESKTPEKKKEPSKVPALSQIDRIVEENDLTVEKGVALKNSFYEYQEAIQHWKGRVSDIVVTDIEQEGLMKQAREIRLQLVPIRTGIDKKRKAVKEDALNECRAIDAVAKVFTEDLRYMEAHLQTQEDFKKVYLDNERLKLRAKRLDALKEYSSDPMLFGEVEALTAEQFEKLLEDQALLKAARIRKAKEEEEAIEAERLALEAEEKAWEEKQEKERKEKAAKEAAEKAALQKSAKEAEAARAKAEAEARKAREEAEAMKRQNDRLLEEAEAEKKRQQFEPNRVPFEQRQQFEQGIREPMKSPPTAYLKPMPEETRRQRIIRLLENIHWNEGAVNDQAEEALIDSVKEHIESLIVTLKEF